MFKVCFSYVFGLITIAGQIKQLYTITFPCVFTGFSSYL